MARGFSHLLFPRFGMGEVRFEPEVKGEVGWGPDFGGMKSLGHMAPGGPPQRFPSPARREGRGEGVGSGEFPLLDASRRSWKEGGARSQEGYKGTQSVGRVSVGWKSWWSSSWSVVLVSRCVCVEVGVCGKAVRGATRSLELAVGGESGRREGDADWRRSSASCVARTCAFM